MDLIVDFPSRISFSRPRFAGMRCCVEAASPLRCILSPLGAMLDDNAAGQNRDDIEGLLVDFPSRCSTTSNAATRPRVTFQDRPQIRRVEKWSTDPELKPNYWYTEDDLRAFQRDKDQNVAMMRMIQRFCGIRNRNSSSKAPYICPTMTKYARTRMEQTNTTSVGLEHHIDTTVSWKEMTIRREEHCRTVLVEQWKQRGVVVCATTGGSSERRRCQDAIAKVSRECSEWSRTRARVIGTLHAQNDKDDDDCQKSVLGLQDSGSNLEVVGGPSLPTPPSA